VESADAYGAAGELRGSSGVVVFRGVGVPSRCSIALVLIALWWGHDTYSLYYLQYAPLQ
jgi:hypothetical protein